MPTRSCIIVWRSFWIENGFSPLCGRTGRRELDGLLDLVGQVGRVGIVGLGELGGVLAGSFAEDQEVRQRISTQPVRAVQTSRRLAAANKPGTVDICESASTRMPPIM